MSSKTIIALGGCLLLGVAGVVNAEPSVSELQAQVSQLQKQVAQMQAGQNGTWLNERRAEEVKALVREVLADADTRASLLENNLQAGRNKGRFFLADDQGNFLLNVGGTIQVRYIANFRDDEPNPDVENGFTIRRARLELDGHIGSPSILYSLNLQADRNSGTVYAEEATIGYRIMDTLVARVGRAKGPFLREEMVSDRYQLTVERSYVNSLFTIGYIEGLFVNWDVMGADGPVRVLAALHDGSGSGEYASGAAKDFNATNVDLALTGRAEVKLAGEWAQSKQFSQFSEEPRLFLMLGGAVDYEVAKTDIAVTDNDKTFSWTVDATAKFNGFNAMGALMAQHFDNGAPAGTIDNSDAYGAVVQAGYMVIPNKLEPFARWEWYDFRGDDSNNLFTFGANYYIKGQAAKLTLDVVWALDPLPVTSTATGLLSDVGTSGDQITVRAQFQVLF